MSEAKGWLNFMPVIPLTDAVPVRFLDPKWEDAVVSSVDSNGGCDHWWRGDGYGDPGYRVNLAHPQGFGYALRWLWQHPNHQALLTTPERQGQFNCGLASRHLIGQTTDADRLALAQAMEEVSDE